jgi:hypothetical protein
MGLYLRMVRLDLARHSLYKDPRLPLKMEKKLFTEAAKRVGISLKMLEESCKDRLSIFSIALTKTAHRLRTAVIHTSLSISFGAVTWKFTMNKY